MKILVFGKTGQVASELQLRGDVMALGREQADLCDPAACAAIIRQTDANMIINAAAYTAVDKAEEEEALATSINADSPVAMAHAAAEKGIPFLHVSTDYVFDGSGDRPRSIKDTTAPINAYGRSKQLGEAGISNAGGQFAILRTSWVFSAHGDNFVKTMLRLGKERKNLSIVDDQIGGPTAAADIADTLLKMAAGFHAGKGESGVYHYSGAPDVSWKGFAAEIFGQANIDVAVEGISSTAYPTPAPRPKNSRLDCRRLETVFGIKRPDWRVSLADVLRELGECE